jgi:diguanylate cyclase (GGDEF)-like protein
MIPPSILKRLTFVAFLVTVAGLATALTVSPAIGAYALAGASLVLILATAMMAWQKLPGRWKLPDAESTDVGSFIDAETGLGTARKFELVWKEQVARYQRYREPFSLAIIEVHHAKRTWRSNPGVAVGEVARRLQEAARDEDTVVRLSPRRFAVLLSHCEVEGARAFLTRVRDVAQSVPVRGEKGTNYLVATDGVAQWNLKMDSIEDLKRAAQADMGRVTLRFDPRDLVAAVA